MQQITIGTKNQIVIPKEIRQKVKGLKPGNKVSIYSVDDNTITIKLTPKDWIKSTYGIMEKAWEGIDPIRELEKMRNEW